MSAHMHELVRYATLAANGHNTQPWKFVIKDKLIEIHPDYTRRLPVVDPQDRELWISLGCALENLLLAGRAAGYAAEVHYPDVVDFIQIRVAADTPQPSPLLAGRKVTPCTLNRLQLPELMVRWVVQSWLRWHRQV